MVVETGLTFEQVDEMALDDIGDLLAYWSETNRVEQKRQLEQKHLKRT